MNSQEEQDREADEIIKKLSLDPKEYRRQQNMLEYYKRLANEFAADDLNFSQLWQKK